MPCNCKKTHCSRMVCCCLKQNKKCTSECDCVGCKNKGGPPPPSDSSSSCSSSSSPPTSGIVTGKCQAVTQKGNPCKFKAISGGYCWKHRPPSPPSSSTSSSSSSSSPPTPTDAEKEIEKKMGLMDLTLLKEAERLMEENKKS